MRRNDLGSALFLLGFGLAAALQARRLAPGTLGRPGPGFFPFYLGVALSIVALALLLRAALGRSGMPAARPETGEPLERWKVVASLAALFVYAFVLEILGFVATTALLIFFLFRVIERQSWAVSVGGSILTAGFSYVLFKVWLGVQLPAGLWVG
jgi:putative tricarboxylic transport membrane protein